MTKKFTLLSSFFVCLLIVTACEKGIASQDLNDPNCIIGYEDKAKDGRIIGDFKSITQKAKMLTVGVKSDSHILQFEDSTQWTWSNEVKNLDDLKEKKGCVLVDFKMDGAKKIATAIQILPPFKVPAEWIINISTLKKLMQGTPSANKELTIVDSRPGPKFAEGSIPGSINIPLPDIKSGAGFEKLPQDKNAVIVFYCGGLHCKLAPSSALIASKKGYTNIKVYHAGYPDWIKSGNAGFAQSGMILDYQKKTLPMIIIDIRADAKTEHIPGAAAISKNDVAKFKAQFPKGEDKARAPFIIYGNSTDEKEAFAVAGKITALGYKNVNVLKGGIEAYKKAGGSTASDKLVTSISYVHKNPPGFVSGADFMKIISATVPDDVIFIDVRETGEIAEDPAMTLFGAQNIPLSQLTQKVSSLDKSKKYYTFCASGVRAAIGREIMAQTGLKAFYVSANIEGNMNSGIILDEKLKITPEMIKKFRSSRLLTTEETKKEVKAEPKKDVKLKTSKKSQGC